MLLLLLAGACSHQLLPPLSAQDNAARAAAEREAAEERYKLLNSAVDALTTGQAELQRRISALADEVRSVRAQDNKIDTGKFVTREEFNRLVKAIDEIEQKREADNRLIREKFEQLEKYVEKVLNTPASPAPPKKNKGAAAADKGAEKLTEKPADKPEKTSETAARNQEGVYYEIKPGNNLLAIVNAHNKEFKKQGKKTTLQLIHDSNPGLKDTNLKVGQKIFVPLVPE